MFLSISRSPVSKLLSVAGVCLLSAMPLSAQQQQTPKVSVAAAQTRMITDQATFIGRGEAIDKIDVMARVNGFLEETLVENGAEVGQGDLLFRIESSAYEATLASNQASLQKAQANLELARLELERKETLLQRGSAPQAERDTALAQEKAALADVRAAEAAVKQAELNLSYTEIHAPFPGRLGRVQVSHGDVVSSNGSGLVTLVREAPIYVSFALNEKQFVTILEQLDVDTAELQAQEQAPTVHVTLPNGHVLEETGRIAFVDNRIDPSTGTITLRAEFPNEKRLLIDGSFVSVAIESPEPQARVVIPQAAIQRDQRGDFVLTIGAQSTVEQRYITTGDTVGTEIIVTEGLQEGESVIVEGLQRVRPGAAVDAVLATQGGE